jgi:hypothetical protein
MTVKKLVVSVATIGLTMCNSGGAVDPAPQPLVCNDSGDGSELHATATLSGTTLTIDIETPFDAQWKSTPSLSNVVGGNVKSIKSSGSMATIVMDVSGSIDGGVEAGAPDAGPSTGGSFTLKGEITDNRTTCSVSRTFTFTISLGSAQITRLEDSLPLRRHDPAGIEVMGRTEGAVELRATGARARDAVVWTATAGSLAHEDGTVRWTLPQEPGLYQIEVLVDRGGEGVALDTLVMEVV